MSNKSEKIECVIFPDVSNANQDGLLASGGDLSLNTLVSAYTQGIFPWFNNDQPILWWSPDPRLVLFPEDVRVSKSLGKTLRQNKFELRCNTAFEQVIKGCALRGAESQEQATQETWITESMHSAYLDLHHQGYAHSIEVWQDEQLVGGLYGLALGPTFFGESMFSRTRDASKVALVGLCKHLTNKEIDVIDCQVASEHLFSMGASEIPRSLFLQFLEPINLAKKTNKTKEHVDLRHGNFAIGIENAINNK